MYTSGGTVVGCRVPALGDEASADIHYLQLFFLQFLRPGGLWCSKELFVRSPLHNLHYRILLYSAI